MTQHNDIERHILAFQHYPGGVAVITADSPTGPVALTATSIVSVSAAPPLLAFSLGHRASTADSIRNARSYVVHFLGRDQLDIARLCATSGVDELDAGSASLIPLRATESHVTSGGENIPPLAHHNRSWHHLDEHSQVS